MMSGNCTSQQWVQCMFSCNSADFIQILLFQAKRLMLRYYQQHCKNIVKNKCTQLISIVFIVIYRTGVFFARFDLF